MRSMNEGDKKWIQDMITYYDHKYPNGEDSIALCVVTAKQEYQQLQVEQSISKSGVVRGNEAGRRHSIAIPSRLYAILKKRYPTLFTQDIKWFKRNFPMFTVAK